MLQLRHGVNCGGEQRRSTIGYVVPREATAHSQEWLCHERARRTARVSAG
jgi:hypothetical protein